MAAKRYLSIVAGKFREVIGLQVSAGAASGGNFIAARDDGTIDPTWLPPGVGADVFTCVASEALAAGAVVNIYSNAGAFAMRNADATIEGKEAWGFTTAAFASGATATGYAAGNNTNVTGLTPGAVYLATTPGGVTNTPPSASGNVVQELGIASAATSFNYERARPVTLA